MRIVYGLLCLLMLLFAVLQHDDPDGPFWALVYAVPAALAGIAAFAPQRLRAGPGRALASALLVLAVAATIFYWPQADGWWRRDVWWHDEPAREGMGMMIVTVILALVALPAMFTRR